MTTEEDVMFIARKALVFIRRHKASAYSRSDAWKNHPLNIPEPAFNAEQIDKELKEIDICSLKEFNVNSLEYSDFKNKIKFSPLYAMSCRDKKILEHFIAFKMLSLKSGDTYIDVGSQDSPFTKLLRRSGIDAFSQDLEYKPGVHKWRIGSSADNIPMPDGSIDKMSMQCAFEHFNGGVDTGFIKELVRILRTGGKCCIVPLYLANIFLNYVDPTYDY